MAAPAPLSVNVYDYQRSSTDGSINSPELTSSLKRTQRAVTTDEQGWNLIMLLEQENKDRNLKNRRIAAKRDSEKPYNEHELKTEGLSWKSNFSSKPLGSLIEKVAPRLPQALKSMRYLTASAFPDSTPDSSAKTEFFRRTVTETVRAREGWEDLIDDISLEDVLFGFTCVAWLDEYSWFPRFYRQDMFFVPVATRQRASLAQLVVLKDSFLVHELFDFIKEKQAASDAGWNIDETVEAINKAMPDPIRSTATDTSRVYEDLNRECSLAAAYTGAKAVMTYQLLVTEIDGKVSHYIYDGITRKRIFEKNDRFPSMQDAVAFFAWQKGNGSLHSSKGIGREVYAMAGVLDRARNEVVDRLQLSGKIILNCDEKDINRFRMHVVGNAVLIGNEYKVDQTKINGNVEEFFTLDNFLQGLLDQIAGSTSPKAFEGERVTKAAVELYAAREEERRDVVLDRFLTQFARMFSTIQKRICSPKAVDKDALEMQKKLLKVLTREELDYISEQPAASTVLDFTDGERQRIAMLAQEGRGNPMYNQRELEKRKLTAIIGTDFAESVLLPDPDPTSAAEQTRQQQLELLLLSEGAPVPVSPRDGHEIHLSILKPALMSAAQSVVEHPDGLPQLQAIVAHFQGHIQGWAQTGVDKTVMAEDLALLKQCQLAIQQLNQLHAQAEQAGMNPDGSPIPPDPNAPPPPAPAPEPADPNAPLPAFGAPPQ